MVYNSDSVHGCDVMTTHIQEDVLKLRLQLATACRLIHRLLSTQLTVDNISKAKQVLDLREEAEMFIAEVQFGSDIQWKELPELKEAEQNDR